MKVLAPGLNPFHKAPWSDFRPQIWGPLGLVVALFIAGVTRVGLSGHSLWFDELASVYFSSQPLHRLWSGWMLRETNPPLYYSILHIWIGLFGATETALRLPAIIGSLIAIVTTYAGMQRNFDVKSAVVAALLLAFSTGQLFFAEQVRAYIFVYLAVTIAFFGLLSVLRAPENASAGWCAYCAGSIAAIYFHTVALIWPLAASMALIFTDWRYLPFYGSRWLRLLMADLVIVAGASWWLGMTYLQIRTPNSDISWIPWPGLIHVPTIFFRTIFLSYSAKGWLRILPLAVASLAALEVLSSWRRPKTRFIAACLLLSVLFLVLMSLKQTVLLDRTILWVSIFPLVLASSCLAGLPLRVQPAIFGAIIGLFCYNLRTIIPLIKQKDWDAAAVSLAKDPHAVVIVESEAMAVDMTAECFVRLGMRPCPFPIVAMVLPADHRDSWARGGAENAGLDSAPAGISPNSDVYLYRRLNFYDPLTELQQLGMLNDVSAERPTLLGPLPDFAMADLMSKGYWRDGLFIVAPRTDPADRPVSLQEQIAKR